MPGKTVPLLLAVSCSIFGALIAFFITSDIHFAAAGTASGFILALIIIRYMRIWERLDLFRILGGAAGLLFGALAAYLIILALGLSTGKNPVTNIISLFILTVFSLIAMQLGSIKAKEIKHKVEKPLEQRKVVGILDTSVIIDGRIADVCETGFLDGDIIIPQFVLKELQMIADSSEPTKRTRGRRGLDILNKIKKQPFVKIIIDETDYPSIKEVDQKLIHMAKETGHAILTNDFNLNKVAEVQSIQVLNINQLANSLKPIVLPGETMKVVVLKEGKEPAQGIAYLDDGTMVVVDSGRRCIGKTIDVTVTSVLQTTAGRMIFAVTKNH